MKTPLSILLMGAMGATVAFAQEFVAPSGPSNETPLIPVQTEQRPSVEGIVKQIFTVDKPWQMINPAAPAKYGNGQEDVTYSRDDEGKPKGFILFALEW